MRAGKVQQNRRDNRDLRSTNKALVDSAALYQQHMGQALDTMSRLTRMLEVERT